MANLQFKATKVCDDLLPEGVSQLYQGHIVKSDQVDTSSLAERVATRTRFDLAVVRNIIASFGDEMLAAVRSGERPVVEGLFTTRFVVNGSFTSEDDTWDPARHSVGLAFIVLDPTKSAISEITPLNVLGKVTVRLNGAQDATTLEQNAVTGTNTLLLQGVNIKITAANTDEGVWLMRNGADVEKATVTESTAGTIDCHFAGTAVAGDDYVLQVRGRGGLGTNRSLVSSSISGFTVKTA